MQEVEDDLAVRRLGVRVQERRVRAEGGDEGGKQGGLMRHEECKFREMGGCEWTERECGEREGGNEAHRVSVELAFQPSDLAVELSRSRSRIERAIQL